MVPLASKGWRQMGLDASLAMLQHAQAKKGSAGAFELVASDAEKLPFRDGAFDGVYTLNVLHWLPDTRAVIQEMYRVARPGGKLLLDFTNSLHPVSIVARTVLRRESSWNKYSLKQIHRLLDGYRYAVYARFRLSPTLWKLPFVGPLVARADRYIPLPLSLVSGYVCIIQKDGL